MTAYQARLRSLNAADFGDLLLHMTELLRGQPDVLAQYHRGSATSWWTSTRTPTWCSISGCGCWRRAHRNICCVGDDDQSIYSWRGAEVENILRFEKDFPGARIVRLEANYRSTAPILAAASALIAHNEGRLGKTLRPGRQDAAGERVTVVSLWDSDEEARMVGERIETLRRDGEALAEMAILVRAGLPDARLRGAADHPRHAVPRGRRAAVLRTPGDPRRHRLYAHAWCSRPTTWRSSASSTCRGAAWARWRCAPCTRRRGPAACR